MRTLCFGISFLLAFLLFAVQPMATKMVLPTLGGTPAVWNTVMFTFQLLLLGGYAYAHFLTRTFQSRWQIRVHTLLIACAFLFLPLMVTLHTSDAMLDNPIPYLVWAFLLQLGIPFFCLAATAPLLQSWVSRSDHPLSKTPYVLYSASNFGSFAGLFGYVGIVEPLLDLREQSEVWSGIYLIGMCALILIGTRLKPRDVVTQEESGKAQPITWNTRLLWIGLAFLPSSLSLGVTTYIATDIASIPLLWVIPLSIYLLSFVDAFRTKPIFVKACQRTAPIIGMAAMVFYGVGGHNFTFTYVFQLLAFGMLAFAIHGWLAGYAPVKKHLTQFYLCLSVGGALGGVLNGLVAPQVFREAFEYPLVLIIASLTAFILLQHRDDPSISVKRHLQLLAYAMARVAVAGFIAYIVLQTQSDEPDALRKINTLTIVYAGCIGGFVSILLYRRYVGAFYSLAGVTLAMLLSISLGVAGYTTLFKDRNFFGVSRVYENPKLNVRYFVHDTTMHGMQSLNPKERLKPLSYYQPLIEILNRLPVTGTKPLAIVGQGVGTLKCMARKNQEVDFYEINPMVKDLADNTEFFTYMRDCPGTPNVMLGDGRIRIAQQGEARYGAIVLDAFSSDSIPAHLLTKEALQLYLDKLAPNGVLIIHTSNRHLNLWPLLGAQARELGIVGYGRFYEAPKDDKRLISSFWVAMAKTDKVLQPLVKSHKGWNPLPDTGARPWTDQYTNLLPYFRFLNEFSPLEKKGENAPEQVEAKQ